MTIEKSPTKGYIGKIVIEIYHNNKNIDFDSIQQAFDEDCAKLQFNEDSYLSELN